MNTKNLLGIADADTPIYRIFSAQRFMNLVGSRQNGLVNPVKWDDPFENFFLRATVTTPAGERGSMETLASAWYGQCWTYNADTDAMWRIYSHDKDGIKVRTTVEKLFASFYDSSDHFASLKYFCGKVDYLTEAAITQFTGNITFQDVALGGRADKFARLLCKREAFNHENEVRLLFQDLDPRRGVNGVTQFNFDVHMVCDEVVLDPRLTDQAAAALEAKIIAAGCTLPISRSNLYRSPSFTIRLA
jgi:hypothetical protein